MFVISPRISLANDSTEKKVDNSLLEESVEKFYRNNFSEVQDNEGNNVTMLHKSNINKFYENNEFDKIRDYILENKISLAWYDGISYRASLGKSSSKTFYKLYKSTNYGSIQKEWVVKLSGTFYYDQNKKIVTSVGKPTLSIQVARFGAGFSPYLSNVSTSGTKNGSYGAKFSASYNMKANMNIKQSGVTIKGIVNFPRDTVSYTSSL